MATAPPLPHMSVEEYLLTDFEPSCEYLEGVLVPKPVPDYVHSRLQKLLLLMLAGQEQTLGIDTLPELHVRVGSKRFRIPDLSGLTAVPTDSRFPDESRPPLFTVEIVSLDEPWPGIRAKLTDHLAMGVSSVIICDPYNRTVMVASQNELLHELASPLVVSIPVPDAGTLEMDFDDLFRRL